MIHRSRERVRADRESSGDALYTTPADAQKPTSQWGVLHPSIDFFMRYMLQHSVVLFSQPSNSSV